MGRTVAAGARAGDSPRTGGPGLATSTRTSIMKRYLVAFTTLAVSISGCAVAPGGSDATGEEPVGAAEQAIWTPGSSDDTAEWSSGATSNLSAWHDVWCNGHSFLTKL